MYHSARGQRPTPHQAAAACRVTCPARRLPRLGPLHHPQVPLQAQPLDETLHQCCERRRVGRLWPAGAARGRRSRGGRRPLPFRRRRRCRRAARRLRHGSSCSASARCGALGGRAKGGAVAAQGRRGSEGGQGCERGNRAVQQRRARGKGVGLRTCGARVAVVRQRTGRPCAGDGSAAAAAVPTPSLQGGALHAA